MLFKFVPSWKEKQLDLRVSVMKPLGAKWLVELYDYLKGKPDIVKNGFKDAGILD